MRRTESVEFSQLLLARSITQTPDLQRLRRLDEGGQHLLGHVGLALVHVLHQALEDVKVHVLHDDDGMLVQKKRGFECLLKVFVVFIIINNLLSRILCVSANL